MASDLPTPGTIAELERLFPGLVTYDEHDGALRVYDADDDGYVTVLLRTVENKHAPSIGKALAQITSLLRAVREREAAVAAASAYRALSTCYRLGAPPSEKLFKRLAKASAFLDTAPPADGKEAR